MATGPEAVQVKTPAVPRGSSDGTRATEKPVVGSEPARPADAVPSGSVAGTASVRAIEVAYTAGTTQAGGIPQDIPQAPGSPDKGSGRGNAPLAATMPANPDGRRRDETARDLG